MFCPCIFEVDIFELDIFEVAARRLLRNPLLDPF
jgi:hypothetical protein